MLNSNTWNHLTVRKQMIVGLSGFYGISAFKVINAKSIFIQISSSISNNLV